MGHKNNRENWQELNEYKMCEIFRQNKKVLLVFNILYMKINILPSVNT